MVPRYWWSRESSDETALAAGRAGGYITHLYAVEQMHFTGASRRMHTR
jgi:hypothetical protein